MKRQTSLSIIVTAFNEETNVSPFLNMLKDFLLSQEIEHQVIFVDDGSTDNTFDEAQKFSDWERLELLRLPINGGSGAAIREGLKCTQGEWYAWLPCDLEIRPKELMKPLEKRLEQDVVVTYFGSGLEARSWMRRFLSNAFTSVLNLCFGQRLPYYNGLSLVRRKFIDEEGLFSNGFFFHAELLIKVLSKTTRVNYVPICLSPRNAEKTKAISLKVLGDVVSCFLKTFWQVRVLSRFGAQQ